MHSLVGTLPFVFLVAFALLRYFQGQESTRSVMEGYLFWAFASYFSAQVLSAFHAISPNTFLAFWIISLTVVTAWLCWHIPVRTIRASMKPDWPFAIIAVFAGVLFFICLTAEPQIYDSLTYHLPRIEHWLQNGSLAHYPTPNGRQNAYGQLAEILMLHTRALRGSDSLYLLVQWTSMICCVVSAFRITAQLGGGRVHCWVAAVFAATLPMGVLQSTTTQNDYVSAALLAMFVSFGLEALDRDRPALFPVVEALAAGALAGMVKPSVYLIGAGFAVLFALQAVKGKSFRFVATCGFITLVLLAMIVAPFAMRNFKTYGTATGNVSPDVLNSSYGVPQTLDNLILNVAQNFVTGFERVDNYFRAGVLKTNELLRLDRNRSDTVFGHTEVQNPRSNGLLHPDYGPNPVHCAFAIVAFFLLFKSQRPSLQIAYGVAVLAGIVLFASAVRWQSWGVRLQLPAFILVAPIVGLCLPNPRLESWRTIAVIAMLTLAGLPALLFNQIRTLVPFGDRPSYLMSSWSPRNYYGRGFSAFARDLLCRMPITKVGLMTADNAAEYPIWLVLRSVQSTRTIRIEHVGSFDGYDAPAVRFEPEIIVSTLSSRADIELDGRYFRRIYPTANSGQTRISVYASKEVAAKLPDTPIESAEARDASRCR